MLLWHAIYTAANLEERARDHVASLGIEAFLPMMRRVNVKHEVRVSPLFPRYLFFALWQGQDWSKIPDDRSVNRILAEPDGRFSVASESEIQKVREQIDVGKGAVTIDERPSKNLKRGQRIVITGGTLQGLEALFIEDDGERVRVMLCNIFGRQVPTTIEADLVEGAA